VVLKINPVGEFHARLQTAGTPITVDAVKAASVSEDPARAEQ